MKARNLVLSLFIGTLGACGGPSSDDDGRASGGKGGSASGGKGGSASGGKGGSASGGKGGSASGGKGGSASGGSGSGGNVAGSGGMPSGSGGVVGSGGASAGTGGTPAAGGALTEGLIGYWSFDEGQGTAIKDTSGKANDGVMLKGTTAAAPVHPSPQWVDGQKGKAMAFGGIDDWVRVPRSDSIDTTGTTGSASVTAWVKLNQYGQTAANSNYNMILNRHEVGTGYEHFGLGVVLGKPVANIHFFFAQAAEVVKLNGWTHLAMTYDGITQAIYVDGTLGSTADIGWPIAADTTDVTIGGAQNTDVIKEFIDGAIDEVRLYSRALSAPEIGEIMNLK